MSLERVAATSLVESLDRILDKGIVFDAWVRIAVRGIEVLETGARIVLDSIDVPPTRILLRRPRWG